MSSEESVTHRFKRKRSLNASPSSTSASPVETSYFGARNTSTYVLSRLAESVGPVAKKPKLAEISNSRSLVHKILTEQDEELDKMKVTMKKMEEEMKRMKKEMKEKNASIRRDFRMLTESGVSFHEVPILPAKEADEEELEGKKDTKKFSTAGYVIRLVAQSFGSADDALERIMGGLAGKLQESDLEHDQTLYLKDGHLLLTLGCDSKADDIVTVFLSRNPLRPLVLADLYPRKDCLSYVTDWRQTGPNAYQFRVISMIDPSKRANYWDRYALLNGLGWKLEVDDSKPTPPIIPSGSRATLGE